MGRKIPTCFCCRYLEANNISALINWLDPDGKYIVVAPDWLSLPLCTLQYFIRFLYHFYAGGRKKNNFNIEYRQRERVNLLGWSGKQT